ncbi:MAG: ribosomal RNA small subunit methyltransferase A [Planctomycetes bacterium]|nr:ribosomal RNA small subunit methyltransferase A [Planctomycetota bacterium]
MSVPHVQTKQEIERLLAASGVRPRKRFGQNFLIDGNLMRRVAEVAELSPRDLALEVGAGTGGLTDLLAAGAGSVICVEIDTVLFAIVTDRFRQVPTVRLVQGDVLESKHRIHADVGEAIRAFRGGSGGAVKLVANLPYQVATPLVLNLLVDFPQVRRLVFTVQAEVGERLVARPGVKAYGPLAIIAQLTCDVATVTRIGPQSFWPRPAIDSVLLRLDRRDSDLIAASALKAFATFVRAVFEHRRKTIRSALGYVLSADVRDRVCQDIDSSRRPESFSITEWVALFHAAQPGQDRHA